MIQLKFLDLDFVKAHLRIDEDTPDAEILLYAAAAEQEALNFLERSLESIYEEFGQIPPDIILACLCHIGTSYKYRETVTDRTLHRLPYMWEARLIRYKPANKI